MRVAHFYHLWRPGQWREPAHEHLDALVQSGFEGPVHLSFAGTEHETLERVREYAQRNEGAVLYAHTKGASDPSDFNARWRRSMTDRLVRDWRANLAHLEGHDAVGCHWLTAARFPDRRDCPPEQGNVSVPFFGGNFWLARCEYLRTLPPCPQENRWDAERWIGMGDPRVFDLLPGWPADHLWPETSHV